MLSHYAFPSDENATLDAVLIGLSGTADKIVAVPLSSPEVTETLGCSLVVVETFTHAAHLAFARACHGVAIRVRPQGVNSASKR